MYQPDIDESDKNKVLGFFDRMISKSKVKPQLDQSRGIEFSDSDLLKKLKEFVRHFDENNILELIKKHKNSPEEFAKTTAASELIKLISPIEQMHEIISKAGELSPATASMYNLYERVTHHNDIIRAAYKQLNTPKIRESITDNDHIEEFLSDKRVMKMSTHEFAEVKSALTVGVEYYGLDKKAMRINSQTYRDAAEAAEKEKPRSFLERVKVFFTQAKKKFLPEHIGSKVLAQLSDADVYQKDMLSEDKKEMLSDMKVLARHFLHNQKTIQIFEDMVDHSEEHSTIKIDERYVGKKEFSRRFGLVFIKVMAKLDEKMIAKNAQFSVRQSLLNQQLQNVGINTVELPAFDVVLKQAYRAGIERYKSDKGLLNNGEKMEADVFAYISQQVNIIQRQQFANLIRRAQLSGVTTNLKYQIVHALPIPKKPLFAYSNDLLSSNDKFEILYDLFKAGKFSGALAQ